MDKGNNTNFNQLANKTKGINLKELFSDDDNVIFCDENLKNNDVESLADKENIDNLHYEDINDLIKDVQLFNNESSVSVKEIVLENEDNINDINLLDKQNDYNQLSNSEINVSDNLDSNSVVITDVVFTKELDNELLDNGKVEETILENEDNINDMNNNSDKINNTNVVSLQDDVNEDDVKKNDRIKLKITSMLTDRKVFLWVSILIFIFTSITVGKTFYLRSIVDEYEEVIFEVESKESEETMVYLEEEVLEESIKDIAASELVSCINSSIDVNNLPSSITSIVKEINNYYNQSNNYFAFKYKDIYTGFSISYNENQKIFTASTIKAPKDIYIYEMASQGNVNLDDKLTYTSRYYNTGSGTLKNKSFNTKYDVRTLLRYSTVYSDNAAHNMLMDKYGRENMLSFWKEKGTDAIFTVNNNWGHTNAHDASIYMEELYKFYVGNEEYGQELMNNFMNAKPKFILGKNNYKVANKSGWSGSAIHDVSIVFADNPYIVVALSNLGNTDYYMGYFNKANNFAYRLHTEYWKYKMDMCSNINQY